MLGVDAIRRSGTVGSTQVHAAPELVQTVVRIHLSDITADRRPDGSSIRFVSTRPRFVSANLLLEFFVLDWQKQADPHAPYNIRHENEDAPQAKQDRVSFVFVVNRKLAEDA